MFTFEELVSKRNQAATMLHLDTKKYDLKVGLFCG